jgi:hypothetical protein
MCVETLFIGKVIKDFDVYKTMEFDPKGMPYTQMKAIRIHTHTHTHTQTHTRTCH